ncbi:MAG: zinc ribbon domain-containing protein [Nitrospira sp.]|nr:zinc ribbon domain-containing protein [Nitrospira sp.]
MLYCPKCNLTYEEGKKFCKECGGKLVVKEEADSVSTESHEKPEVAFVHETKIIDEKKKYCPSCGIEYTSDKKFCKTCGVVLSNTPKKDSQTESVKNATTAFKFTPTPPKPSFETVSDIPSSSKVKSILRKKKKLLKNGQKMMTLIGNLEKQKGLISEDALAITMRPYQMKLEEIEKEISGINDFLNELQKKVTVEIDGLEKEVLPFKNRLSELKTIRKAKGLTSSDFNRFKKEPKQASKRLDSKIKKRKKIMQLLLPSTTGKLEGAGASLYMKVAAGIVILAVLGVSGYFGYKYFNKKDKDEITFPDKGTPQALPEEEIRKVFETIKKANLSEDINLFMSCYSPSYPTHEDKKNQTVKNWQDYDFADLSFTVRDLIVNQNTAEVTVDWQINARSAKTGETQTFNITNNVVLQKESGQWKITALK